MRHGERADFVMEGSEMSIPYNPEIEHDPPLTEKGLKQAEQAGIYIKERLTKVQEEYKIKFDEVRIETSPFLRCLQTSSRIAKANDISALNVNYLMVEAAGCAQSSTGNPIEQLDIAAGDKDKLSKDGLDGIKVETLASGEIGEHYQSVKDAWANDSDDLYERCQQIK